MKVDVRSASILYAYSNATGQRWHLMSFYAYDYVLSFRAAFNSDALEIR